MMNRNQKLNKLDEKSKAKQGKINSERQDFLKQFNETVEVFKSTFEGGVEVNGLDNLLSELENLNSLSPIVEDLKSAIKEIDIPELPESVEIKGLSSLLKAIKGINKAEVKVDLKPLEVVSNKLIQLIKAVNDFKVPKQGQKPTDFVPMRRVVYVSGRTPMFDDSFYTGGGGGGSAPNPDILGQPISQNAAGTTNLVGGVTNKRIRVVGYTVVMRSAGTVKFQADSSDITGAMDTVANSGVATASGFAPLFSTGRGEALNIVTTGGAGNGHVSYYLE